MYPTLMNLYTGNLDFHKRTAEELPLEKFHEKKCDELTKQLRDLLNEDGRKLLNELFENQTATDSYIDARAFANGFRIAAMLMVEVYYNQDNLMEVKEQFFRHFLHRPFEGTPPPHTDLSD